MKRLDAVKDWVRQGWDALVKRLHRNRSEARILVRLDELEARILTKLETRADSGPAETVPVFTPEASISLNSVSVPIGDGQRTVEFRGVELSQRFYAEGLKRITETLYEIEQGRYLVHVKTLHRGKGLRTEYDLCEVNEDDLKGDGRYVALWRLRQPISLEEALGV